MQQLSYWAGHHTGITWPQSSRICTCCPLVEFKVLIMTYKALNGLGSTSLRGCLSRQAIHPLLQLTGLPELDPPCYKKEGQLEGHSLWEWDSGTCSPSILPKPLLPSFGLKYPVWWLFGHATKDICLIWSLEMAEGMLPRWWLRQVVGRVPLERILMLLRFNSIVCIV